MNNEKKIMEKKIDSLAKDLSRIKKTMESIGGVKKIIKKDVKPFGNGCHVVLPKEFLNKKARVIIS